MKKLLTILTITAVGLVAMPGLARAEDPKPAAPADGKPGRGERGRFDPAERLKMMTEKLGLTQEQQDKIKAIFEKNAPAFKALLAKGRENLTEEDRTKLRELSKGQQEEIAALLTPEQKEKMKEMRGGRRGNRDGKPGAPQSGCDRLPTHKSARGRGVTE